MKNIKDELEGICVIPSQREFRKCSRACQESCLDVRPALKLKYESCLCGPETIQKSDPRLELMCELQRLSVGGRGLES